MNDRFNVAQAELQRQNAELEIHLCNIMIKAINTCTYIHMITIYNSSYFLKRFGKIIDYTSRIHCLVSILISEKAPLLLFVQSFHVYLFPLSSTSTFKISYKIIQIIEYIYMFSMIHEITHTDTHMRKRDSDQSFRMLITSSTINCLC